MSFVLEVFSLLFTATAPKLSEEICLSFVSGKIGLLKLEITEVSFGVLATVEFLLTFGSDIFTTGDE